MKKFNNIIQEPIFSSFVFSTELSIDLESIKKECLVIEDTEEGISNSNKGGYHSKILNFNDQRHPTLKELNSISLEFSNYVCKEINISERVCKAASWININRNSNYNVMHSHNENLLTGVFYVKIPPTANSNLILYRSDGAEYFNRAFSGDFVITPIEGRLYIFSPWLKHSVTVNDSTEERISIAFNFYSSTDK
jgi:uncharacterized protein (TIGR02466 family)